MARRICGTLGFRSACRCLIAALLLPAMAAAQPSPPLDPAIEARIQRIEAALLPPVVIVGQPERPPTLAERMAALHVPGVSVAVVHGGKLEWARGFGVARIGGPPVDPDTLFQAGSISKPVATLAALRLVQADRLDLDADVNRWLKTWRVPSTAFTDRAPVTLRGLLSHTAGLTVHGFAGYAAGQPVPTLVQVLDGTPPANSQPIRVDEVPGTVWRYSGGGFTVLQQLLIDVTGEPFARHVQQAVLGPLDMVHSTYEEPLPAERAMSGATPYKTTGEPVEGGAHVYPEMAAAGLWTTPSDLARYIMAVQRAWSGSATELLTPATARAMLTPGLGHWGLGLAIEASGPNPCFSHDGVDEGFVAVMAACVGGDQDGAVIMTNGAGGSGLTGALLRAIAEEYRWPAYRRAERRLAVIDPALYDRYVGRYSLRPGFDLWITRDGGHLYCQGTGQRRFELFPQGETEFFLRVVDATIAFRATGAGPVNALVLHQYGVDQTGTRID